MSEIDEYEKLCDVSNDAMILEISLKSITLEFDSLITACLKKGGPTKQDIAMARGFLPSYCVNSYTKKTVK